MDVPHELIPERSKLTKHIAYTEKLFSPARFEIVRKPQKCGSSVALRQAVK